jgi:hypothetical protein
MNEGATAKALALPATYPLKQLVEALRRARRDAPANTSIMLSLCRPDDRFSDPYVVIPDNTDEHAAIVVATFVERIDEVVNAIQLRIDSWSLPPA